MKESKMTTTSSNDKLATHLMIGLVACLLVLAARPSQASGIFELSLGSLVDSLGRDLRDDCCAWQNTTLASSHQLNNHNQNHHQQHHQHNLNPQQQQQAQTCDPSKCQLIIRICVKNYQTQIEPSQCTFGELSAQVLKQQQQDFAAGYSSSAGFEPMLLGANLPAAYQANLMRRTAQQPALAALKPPRSQFASPATATNIHHQRMLSQTQAFQQPPFFNYQQQPQSHHQSAPAAARNQQQQLKSPMSGQSRALRTIAFNQPISFPFNFTWPGSFSLIIDAWFESPLLQQVAPNNHLAAPTTVYDLYKRQLIIKHSMRGWLAVKNEWTNDVHKTDSATLGYSYRVTCQPNYYGDQCNILCRPRDDFYGHYTCSQQGNIVCLPGWQGSYCLEPVCSPGCHKEQGNCSRPNECQCRYGWQGPACEQCVLYPGCVHGSCNKPLECICDEGWGGLLCNEDLNFCANHQPCRNDGICTNTFDANGVGSYTCACPAGFAGKNCERRLGQQLDYETLPSAASSTDLLQVAAQASTSSQTNSSNFASLQIGTAQTQAKQQVVPSTAATNDNQQQQQQPQHHQQQVTSSKPSKPSPRMIKDHYHYPLTQTAAAAAAASSINSNANQPMGSLDPWVMTSWAVIMICSIVLVLVFSFRAVIERASQRGQWHHRESSSHVEDVAATLQNQQNLCKSRTSLNAAAAMMACHVGDHKSPSAAAAATSHQQRHYDRVLSLVGDEQMRAAAGIYAAYYQQHRQPGTSNRFPHQLDGNNNSSASITQGSPKRRGAATGAGDRTKKSHEHQKHQQQYRSSQHSLHATHENNNSSSNNNSGTDSEAASTSSSDTPAVPPPPYTIAQSTHSYPNLASYQRAPKPAAGPTAINNALYGYSPFAGIPVVAAPAPPVAPHRQQAVVGADGGAAGIDIGSGSGVSNNAASSVAANSTYQSSHYIFYPVHFMPN